MSTTDTEYLKERLEKKKAQDALSTQSQNSSVDATSQLQDVTDSTSDLKEQIRQRKLHRQAAKLDAEDKAIEEKALNKEKLIQTQQEKELEAERIKEEGTTKERARLIGSKVGEVVSNVGQGASNVQDRVASLKTTGGIALLLVILMLLLFIVVRVNASGDTRLKQLWYMLNGRTQLKGKQTLTGATNVGGGSSGSFGTTTNPATNTLQPLNISNGSIPTPLTFRGNTTF